MKINTDIKLNTDVTFVMSIFNEEHKLANAIESILNQNYPFWFLILVNDGSTDDTQKVINHYQKIDERITCVVNKTNKGLAYSLNKAIENCNTKYIARIDADDIVYPGRLEAQLTYLEKHPEIDVLLVLKNTGHYINGDYIGDMKPGTLILTGPNLPHALHLRNQMKTILANQLLQSFNFREVLWELTYLIGRKQLI